MPSLAIRTPLLRKGVLSTDYTFTGQQEDASGLLYYDARYYDPNLGSFISPDPLVPDPGLVFDYNRYMYTRGNPLKYDDPTRKANSNAGMRTTSETYLPKSGFSY